MQIQGQRKADGQVSFNGTDIAIIKYIMDR